MGGLFTQALTKEGGKLLVTAASLSSGNASVNAANPKCVAAKAVHGLRNLLRELRSEIPATMPAASAAVNPKCTGSEVPRSALRLCHQANKYVPPSNPLRTERHGNRSHTLAQTRQVLSSSETNMASFAGGEWTYSCRGEE